MKLRWKRGRVSTPRRIAGVCAALAVVLVGVVAGPGVAFAGDGPWFDPQYSTCSKSWNYNQYGASARAVINYDADRITTTRYRILWARSYVDTFEDCGPAGHPVSAYKISTTTQFIFSGTNLSCGVIISWPPGFTCTATGDDIRFSDTATCSPNKTACPNTFGQMDVVARSGTTFDNFVLGRTHIKLQRNDGGQHQWATSYV